MSTIAATNLKNASSGSNNIVLGSDGTTRITTLADSAGANTSTPAAIAAGIAKAWVNFNGTTASPSTIRASYNVSSVTKNATGDYTVNFTTTMPDNNYTFTAGSYKDTPNGGSAASITARNYSAPSGTTSGLRIATFLGTVSTPSDFAYVDLAIFR
jgi:hypothetical protein